MKIIKRNGSEAVFDISKIIAAITKANNADERERELTPEQIRRAGEYEFDTYMGDVWSEGDHDGEPEPTYDEFIADPRKYGVTYTDEDAANDPDMDMYPVNWGRYKSTVRQK